MSDHSREKKANLHEAIEQSDLDRVRTLIQGNADVNQLSYPSNLPLGVPPLFLAVQCPDDKAAPIVEELLRGKAIIDHRVGILERAVFLGRRGAAKILLEAKAQANPEPLFSDFLDDGAMLELLMDKKATISHYRIQCAVGAGSIDLVNVLLKKIPNLFHHPYMLYLAAETGRIHIVQALLTAKAEANAAVKAGSPLQAAYTRGHVKVIELLLAAGAKIPGEKWLNCCEGIIKGRRFSKNDLSVILQQLVAAHPGPAENKKSDYYQAICCAITTQSSTAVKALLAAKVSASNTPPGPHSPSPVEYAKQHNAHEDIIHLLQQAFNREKRAAVMMGLWHPAQPKKDEKSSQASLIAVPEKTLSLTEAISQLNLPAVKKALETKTEISTLTQLLVDGGIVGKLEERALPIVQALLAANASVDQNPELLQKAIDGGRRRILKSLLDAKANPTHPGFMSSSIILTQAIQLGDEASVKLLLQAKAALDSRIIERASHDTASHSLIPLLCRELISRQPEVKPADLLHLALRNGLNDAAALTEIIETTAVNLETLNEKGETPLLVAAKANPKAIPALLEAKANVAALSKTGHTALHVLMRSDIYPKPELVIYKALIDKGANPNAPGPMTDAMGQSYSPLQLAVSEGILPLVALFTQTTKVEDLHVAALLARQLKRHQNIIDALENRTKELLASSSQDSAVAATTSTVVTREISTSIRHPKRKRAPESRAPHHSSMAAKLTRGGIFDPQVIREVYAFADIATPKPDRKAAYRPGR